MSYKLVRVSAFWGIIIEYPANLDFVFLHENKVTNPSTCVETLSAIMKPYPNPYSNHNMIGDCTIIKKKY